MYVGDYTAKHFCVLAFLYMIKINENFVDGLFSFEIQCTSKTPSKTKSSLPSNLLSTLFNILFQLCKMKLFGRHSFFHGKSLMELTAQLKNPKGRVVTRLTFERYPEKSYYILSHVEHGYSGQVSSACLQLEK